jgi:hypothetical protein
MAYTGMYIKLCKKLIIEEKEDIQEKRGWKECKQPGQREIQNKINGETGRNCV